VPSHPHPFLLRFSIAPNHPLNQSGDSSIDPVEFARPSLLGTRAAQPRPSTNPFWPPFHRRSQRHSVFDEAVVTGVIKACATPKGRTGEYSPWKWRDSRGNSESEREDCFQVGSRNSREAVEEECAIHGEASLASHR